MSQKTKIACLLCRGLISFKNGDRSRFLDHMKNEHDARYDFDVVLVVSLMAEEEKKTFVNANRAKLESLTGNTKKQEIPDLKSGQHISTSETKFAFNASVPQENAEEVENIVNTSASETQLTDVVNQVTKLIEEVSEAPIEKAIEREGVLKCKICSKYIKQSQMSDHRSSCLKDEASRQVSEIPKSTKVFKKSPEKVVNEEESPRKGKRKGDDSDDDEWTVNKVKRTNSKSISCNICKKKFSSKLGLTTHERMVHKESRKNLEKQVEETHMPEIQEPLESPQHTQLTSKKQRTTQSSHNNHVPNNPTADQKPIQLPTVDQKPSQEPISNQKPSQPPRSNQKPAQPHIIHQKPIQPPITNQKPTESQTSNQKPTQPQTSNQKPTHPETINQKPTQPETINQKSTQPQTINQKPTQPQTSNQKPTQPQTSNQKPTQPQTSNQKPTQPQKSNQKPTQPPASYQKSTHPSISNMRATQPTTGNLTLTGSPASNKRPTQTVTNNSQSINPKLAQPSLQNPVTTNKPVVQKQQPQKTVQRDPRRTKEQTSRTPLQLRTHQQQAAPQETNSAKAIEKVKPTNHPTRKPTQLTPIGTSKQLYSANEESLLYEEDFDFDEQPLTIDESLEDYKTVTVEVVENSTYFDLGDITHVDALLLDNLDLV